MHIDLYTNGSCCMKRILSASAKSIDPGQPVQTAQADLGKNLLLLNNIWDINPLPHNSNF